MCLNRDPAQRLASGMVSFTHIPVVDRSLSLKRKARHLERELQIGPSNCVVQPGVTSRRYCGLAEGI